MVKFFKDFRKHQDQYYILISGFSLAFLAFFGFVGYPLVRVVSVVAFAGFYFVWGNVHHWLAGDWHIKVALEYFLISAIGCGILLSLILRS